MQLHFDVLDEKRKNILPQLSFIKEQGFYLAGGTALALIFGHRDSIDFDFFIDKPFDTAKLFEHIAAHFKDHEVSKTQEEKNTLSLIIDNEIKLSFFSFPYPLIKPTIPTDFFPLASVEDIVCMKLSAITSRSVMKDYIDLYFIFKLFDLKTLLSFLKEKMPSLDPLLVLKSLVYFDDIVDEKIIFKTKAVTLDEIRTRFTTVVQEYMK